MIKGASPARQWSVAIAFVIVLVGYLPWSMSGLYEFLASRTLAEALLVHYAFDFTFAVSLVEIIRAAGRFHYWSDKRHFTFVFIIWISLVTLSTAVFVTMR